MPRVIQSTTSSYTESITIRSIEEQRYMVYEGSGRALDGTAVVSTCDCWIRHVGRCKDEFNGIDFELNCPAPSQTQNASIACVNRQVLQEETEKKTKRPRKIQSFQCPKQVTRYPKKEKKNKRKARAQTRPNPIQTPCFERLGTERKLQN